MPMPNAPLSDEERQLGEKSLGLVFSYLKHKQLPFSDWYDVAVFGYLCAVQRHLRRQDNPDVPFGKKCYDSMNESVASEFKYLHAKKRYSAIPPVCLNAEIQGTDDGAVFEGIVSDPKQRDLCDLSDLTIRCEGLLRIATPKERKVFCFLASGYTEPETAAMMGISVGNIVRILERFRKKAAEKAPHLIPAKMLEQRLQRRVFSLRLRQALRECGMNQKTLAQKTGISICAIEKYIGEEFMPTEESIQKLAVALGVPADWLLACEDTTHLPYFPPQIPLHTQKENFSRLLKSAMQKCGMSKVDLSKRTGIEPSSIYRYVRGETMPTNDRIRTMADALGVSVAWLLYGDSGESKGRA
jgi:RNA polymerase sigma-70 factor (ECF subfamily)